MAGILAPDAKLSNAFQVENGSKRQDMFLFVDPSFIICSASYDIVVWFYLCLRGYILSISNNHLLLIF